MPSDGSGAPKALIQGGADAIPTSFSPDDRQLAIIRFNSTPDGRPNPDLQVVSVADSKVTPFLNSPSPEQLSGGGEYDVAKDGNRFVMLVEQTQPASTPKRTHVTLVFNFLEELRRATAGTAK